VHDPVIGGADKDIPAAAELLHTTLARHYWDPTGDFGRQMSRVLGLFHGAKPVYAWDVWMIYPPNALWTVKDPPQPVFLMHQLGGLDKAKFPPLDSKEFLAKSKTRSNRPASAMRRYCRDPFSGRSVCWSALLSLVAMKIHGNALCASGL
jgi:hypothetical protein